MITKEQQEILNKIYSYKDGAEYSEEEISFIKEMFDKPEKLRILRKILGILTQEERGLNYLAPSVNLDALDDEKLGKELRIAQQVDERIRQGLFQIGLLVKGELVKEKTEEFEKLNEIAKKKEEEDEKKKEELERKKRGVGENL